MSKKLLFKLLNTKEREVICLVMIDQEKFVDPESNIIDFETMSCKNCANGAWYTLVPTEHHTTQLLSKIREVYEAVTTKPATSFSTMIGRMDTLIDAFSLLFTGSIKYFVVNNHKDINALINPHRDYAPEVVEYRPIDDLLNAVKEMYGSIETMVDDVNATLKSANTGAEFVKIEGEITP